LDLDFEAIVVMAESIEDVRGEAFAAPPSRLPEGLAIVGEEPSDWLTGGLLLTIGSDTLLDSFDG
jgi:hypothetical protein